MQEPITREEYEMIELYLYGLRLLTESMSYYSMTIKQRGAIDAEVMYMTVSFSILSRIFEPTKSPRRSVVAWKKADERPETHTTVYYFTSAQVAGKALDITPGDICRITNGRRISTGGYRFMYLEDFEKLQLTVSNRRRYWWDHD